MNYSFWHCGILLGESDLAFRSGNPGQQGGIFHPTTYGLRLLPRLTGLLSVGHQLKSHIESLGRSTEDLSPDEVNDLLVSSDGGRAMVDLGRTLSEVELRQPDGKRVEVASMTFSDVDEIRRVGQALGTGVKEKLTDLPPDAPRYIVSTTFM